MNLKDPRTQLSWLLILIFLSATFFYKDISLLKNLVIATSSAVIFDFLFWKLRKIEFFPPAAAITTGIIISLLMSPTLPFYELIIAAAIAMFFKNFISGAFKLPFIRFSNRHVFNPAGVGVILTSFIFSHNVSWWAVSFQQTLPFYLILLSPALVSMVRMRRHMITISFIVVYFFLISIINHKSLIINQLLDPTVLFFSLVMLPEPMTTPNKKTLQIIFGFFIALFAIISSKFFTSIDPLIFALLAGNLIFYKIR